MSNSREKASNGIWPIVFDASSTVFFSCPINRRREIGPRSENSLSRSRVSGVPPSPEVIHCRTLPHRCRTILPAEFEASFGRHQISSSLSSCKQRTMRGRYFSKPDTASFRNASANVTSLAVIRLLPPGELNDRTTDGLAQRLGTFSAFRYRVRHAEPLR